VSPPFVIHRGDAPLVLAVPHSGTDIPADLLPRFVSPWLARKDADWWIDQVYAFASDLGATLVRAPFSRSVIDANRDPSGKSLYPGHATTELCPTTTFDGEPLYHPGAEPDSAEIKARRVAFFDPYHSALAGEIARLPARHERVVVYDCHSIRSHVRRLFDGELPQFNIGTNGGATCDAALSAAVVEVCAGSGQSHVRDGRFKGGWTTRHYGRPADGIHAIQMELACRGYLDEPQGAVTPENWPAPYDPATPLIATLRTILIQCIAFATGKL
jgi:formiminoglutamase